MPDQVFYTPGSLLNESGIVPNFLRIIFRRRFGAASLSNERYIQDIDRNNRVRAFDTYDYFSEEEASPPRETKLPDLVVGDAALFALVFADNRIVLGGRAELKKCLLDPHCLIDLIENAPGVGAQLAHITNDRAFLKECIDAICTSCTDAELVDCLSPFLVMDWREKADLPPFDDIAFDATRNTFVCRVGGKYKAEAAAAAQQFLNWCGEDIIWFRRKIEIQQLSGAGVRILRQGRAPAAAAALPALSRKPVRRRQLPLDGRFIDSLIEHAGLELHQLAEKSGITVGRLRQHQSSASVLPRKIQERLQKFIMHNNIDASLAYKNYRISLDRGSDASSVPIRKLEWSDYNFWLNFRNFPIEQVASFFRKNAQITFAGYRYGGEPDWRALQFNSGYFWRLEKEFLDGIRDGVGIDLDSHINRFPNRLTSFKRGDTLRCFDSLRKIDLLAKASQTANTQCVIGIHQGSVQISKGQNILDEFISIIGV